MIQAVLSSDKISSNSNEAFALYDKSRFGEKSNGKIEYSPVEAIFLIMEKKMSLIQNKKELNFEQAFSKLKKIDKRLSIKFQVFKDLRKKGYILKTGLKFGADFRVYKKGVKPGEDHALWLLHPIKESEASNWHDFAAKNRVAHAAKKKLLLALVDDENDATYYEINWVRP